MLAVAALQLALALSPGATPAPPAPTEAVAAPAPAVVATSSADIPAGPAEPGPTPPSIVAPLAPAPLVFGASQPSPTPEIQPPRLRGIGMFVTGGLIGTVGLPFKIIAATSDMRRAGEIDRGLEDPSVCFEICYVGFAFNIISAPLLVTSAGLIGGGMTMHGRWAAHRDAARGLPHDTRRTRLMIGLGFGAIGAGIGAFVASRFAMANAQSEGQWVARRELGWWAALAGLYGGAGVAGYGVGYRAGRRKLDRRLQAGIAPMLSPQLVGLGMAGRF